MAALLAGNIAVVARQPAAALDNAVAQLKKQHPLVTDVAVLATPATGSSGAFDAVIASSGSPDKLAAELETLAPIIKAGGALHVYVAGVSDDNKSSVLMALMIGGFVEAAASSATDIAAFFPDVANAQCFSSKKPAFETGAALSLGKKLSTGTTSALPLKKWTVMADDGDDDDDIIDEDTLLDDTDEVLQAAKDDCGPGVGGKKRACKNCTCGRMDEDDQPVVSDKDLTQMVSSCGSCFKGDAFRCGSCPFLGKPAFKPGMEKVLLNLDDADDI